MSVKKLIILLALIPLLVSGLTIDYFPDAEATKSKGTPLTKYGSATSGIVCGDRLCSEQDSSQTSTTKITEPKSKQGVFESAMIFTQTPPIIDQEKGYFVTEIADGIYWLIDGSYQVMFLTTGQGVIVIDAPERLGQKYLDAIFDVTSEPVTHFIYSHIHKDHVGAAHQFPDDVQYIAHKDAAEHLKLKNDPNRPIPTITFDDTYTLSVGNQILELSYIGAFHSKGDIVIVAPKQKVAMVIDMFHPGAGPFKAFGITKDMNAYLKAHDILLEEYDFDVLVSGHEQILATKDHLKINKEFTLDVMQNAIKSQEIVDFTQIVQEYGHLGRYAVFDALFDAQSQVCSELTLQKWQDKLNELEPFMEDHCMAMLFMLE